MTFKVVSQSLPSPTAQTMSVLIPLTEKRALGMCIHTSPKTDRNFCPHKFRTQHTQKLPRMTRSHINSTARQPKEIAKLVECTTTINNMMA